MGGDYLHPFEEYALSSEQSPDGLAWDCLSLMQTFLVVHSRTSRQRAPVVVASCLQVVASWQAQLDIGVTLPHGAEACPSAMLEC